MKRTTTRGTEDPPPPWVPHHRLLRQVGKGSYGEVWMALDAMGKWCAVKVVYRGELDGGKAYQQEFRGLKQYDDLARGQAHLMPVRDVGCSPGGEYFYYAMELADDLITRQPLPRLASGEELSAEALAIAEQYRPWTLGEQLRREGRLPYPVCLDHAIALSLALEVIHCGGLAHRDIKPSNIVFVNGLPRLADVGLVTAVDAATLSLAGTSGFLPLHGAGTQSGDLFGLGKVIYLMATGRGIHEFPAEVQNLGELELEQRRALAELRAVYDRACDVMPEDRYPSAQAMRQDLELLRGNESVIQLRQLQAKEERWLVQARRQRRRLGLLALATGLSLLGALAAWGWVGFNRKVARQAVLAELEMRQLARMQNRKEGWSDEDWRRMVRASAQGIDRMDVWRHAAATLSGLDARQMAYWRNVEASSALFTGEGHIVLAGYRSSPGLAISGWTNLSTLVATGEGKLCRTPSGAVWILQADGQSCAVKEASTGEVIQSTPLRAGESVRMAAGPVLALSQDGELAAAALLDATGPGRTLCWQVGDGQVLAELPGAATALAFSPDGTLLAIGGEDGTIRLYGPASFQLEATLGPGSPPTPITALAFGRSTRLRSDGGTEGSPWVLAAGDAGVQICIWDLERRIPLAFCLGSTWNVQSLAFHPNGQWLASAGRNGVLLWDAVSGVLQLHLDRACGGDTRALSFDPTGLYLVGGSTAENQFGEVSVWRLEPHRGIRRLRGLKACVRDLAFSPNGERIAALSDEWIVGVWETGSERLRALIEVPPGTLADSTAMAFAPAANQFAYAANGEVRLYCLENNLVLAAWTLGRGRDEGLRFGPSGELLLLRVEPSPAGRQWSLYKLEVRGQAHRQYLQAPSESVIDSLFLPSGGTRFFGAGKLTNTLQSLALGYSLKTGEELWRRPLPYTNKWMRLIVDSMGQWVALEDRTPEGDYPVMCATDGRIIHRPQRSWLAVGRRPELHASLQDDAQTLFVEDLSHADILPIGLDGMWSKDTITFSADERFIATGNNDGSVMVAEIDAVRARLQRLR